MKIHEYQAKTILAEYGVRVPAGIAVLSDADFAKVQPALPQGPWVIKAQVHTGGRGKAGGIKKVENVADLQKEMKAMLGKTLVTHQTGPAGLPVNRIYVEQAQSIQKELYLAFTVNRAKGQPVILASAQGGMDIEELSARDARAIVTEAVDPWKGLQSYQARNLAKVLGFEGKGIDAAAKLIAAVYKTFAAKDCSLLEINPLVVTSSGDLLALDAKMVFEENALYRHPELETLRDSTDDNPLEKQAIAAGVNYIALDGNIGCLVNGAGLAMATMDLIKFHGGEPANFLDVGGGATPEQVTKAFRIILADPKVKAILVNIFGGIMKCDVIAQGIVTAVKEVGMKVPFVVRLEGTNVELGREILKNSGLKLTTATDLADAADKVVAVAGKN